MSGEVPTKVKLAETKIKPQIKVVGSDGPAADIALLGTLSGISLNRDIAPQLANKTQTCYPCQPKSDSCSSSCNTSKGVCPCR